MLLKQILMQEKKTFGDEDIQKILAKAEKRVSALMRMDIIKCVNGRRRKERSTHMC